MGEQTKPQTYAEWLQARMDERELTQRKLAKLLNPDSPEVARRSVRRYLQGMVPLERNRRVISHALGTDDLGPREADAEDDLPDGDAHGESRPTAAGRRARRSRARSLRGS